MMGKWAQTTTRVTTTTTTTTTRPKVTKRYLVERSVDVDEAEGVDAEAEDVDADQGHQRLGSLTHDLGHLQQTRVLGHLEQEYCNDHLHPQQRPWQRQCVQRPLFE